MLKKITTTFTACLLLWSSIAVSAEIRESRALFDIRFLGINFGFFEVASRSDGNSYAISAQLMTSGLLTLLHPVNYKVGTRGWITSDGYIPVRYTETRHQGGNSVEKTIYFEDGKPSRIEIVPPDNSDILDNDGAFDFLIFISIITEDKPKSQLCKGIMTTFDGNSWTELEFTDSDQDAQGNKTCYTMVRKLSGPPGEGTISLSEAPLTVRYIPNPENPGWYKLQRIDHNTKFGPLQFVRK